MRIITHKILIFGNWKEEIPKEMARNRQRTGLIG